MVAEVRAAPEGGHTTASRSSLATIEAEGEELGAAQRDSILGAHGVTPEAMGAFLAVHGHDEAYMADLWREVDERVFEAQGMEPDDAHSEPEQERTDHLQAPNG